MENSDVKLVIRFDADQVTKSLEYDFFEKSHKSIYKTDGRCANTFHFPFGGCLFVEIIGKSRARDEMRFSVSNFTITSISTLGAAQSPLSLFDPKSACVSISGWDDLVQEEDETEGTTRSIVRATEPLPLVAENGQWEMSGFLSVEIEMLNKERKPVIMQRLFYFDPESTAGSGGNIII